MRGTPALVAVMLFGLAMHAGAAEPEAGCGKGQVHPDFQLPKLDGTMGRLSDFRGKPLLLFHFASW